MTTTEQRERTFKEIKRLCYADLDAYVLGHRIAIRLRRTVAFEGYAVSTMDPLNGLPTGCVCNTDVMGSGEDAGFFTRHIYFDDRITEFGWMARHRVGAMTLSQATEGKLERALRHREYNRYRGLRHEVRSVCAADGVPWGGVCLVRENGDPDFGGRELELLKRISPHLGAALRAATLRRRSGPDAPSENTPGVLILDGKGKVIQRTLAAEHWLRDLDGLGRPNAEAPHENRGLPTAVWSVVGALQRSLNPQTEHEASLIPRVCARGVSGRWLTLQASLTEANAGRPPQMVVIISPSEPGEVLKLRTTAYGLTAREKEITGLILRGYPTRQVSATLHISGYTVQDHLKNVFGKTGVRSRRELIKTLFLYNLPDEPPA